MAFIVECTANGGRQYRVTFDGPHPVRIVVIVDRPGCRRSMRKSWDLGDGRPMGLAAACAVRAARKVAMDGGPHFPK